MELELPPTENWPAHTLAKTFHEDDLSLSIAYLECVLLGEICPGPEMFRLGISPLNYCDEELQAVQRKLALAISYKRDQSFSRKAA